MKNIKLDLMKTPLNFRLIPFFWISLLIIVSSCSDDDDVKGPPTDVDGNVYTSVAIGDQEWLVENLKTTSLNDGTPIPETNNDLDWTGLQTPGFSWYENDENQYKEVYGALYNWYTVETGKLCPKGWHVPSAAEWEILHDYVGDSAASKLKESGNTHWSLQNNDATNSTGFTARPGGYRVPVNGFREEGIYGYWWSSSFDPNNNTRIYGREMNAFSKDGSQVVYNKTFGMSIRCLRD
jgi:uncharacterized protein (TIGR02145 family)